MPAWHYAATQDDLPRHGDFLTMELLGKPLLIRNIDGEICAFLNVCSHRHCVLTHQPRGHDPRFRCQYHGWEYTKDGKTARIPDAGCFRPFDRDNARLRKFRTAGCGRMIFVSLADAGPGLEEFLGPLYPLFGESFGPPFRQIWKWEADYEANWKVVAENSLESYHIPCLHRKTFGILPPEETSEHALTERYTTFRTREMFSWISAIQNWFVRRLGMKTTNIYTHHHVHPSLIYTGNDVHRIAQLIVPTSPTTTHHTVWVFGIEGRRFGPLARLLGWTMRRMVKYVARKVILEDAPIFADIQKGLNGSPFRGVIGTREERIHCFQKYVLRNCGADACRPQNCAGQRDLPSQEARHLPHSCE
jgi:phenylpropionate dioxygenase-like ring-hydroxylating dioxygenase large terminal subunit